MIITELQGYILESLETCRALPGHLLEQLAALKFPQRGRGFQQALSQLRYMGLIQPVGQMWTIPGKKADPLMPAAVEIMLMLCGAKAPEFARGRPPCLLTFFAQGSDGWVSAYKIVPVQPGKEEITSLRALQDAYPREHTLLYYLLPDARPDRLSCPPQCYLVRKGGDAYTFLEPDKPL